MISEGDQSTPLPPHLNNTNMLSEGNLLHEAKSPPPVILPHLIPKSELQGLSIDEKLNVILNTVQHNAATLTSVKSNFDDKLDALTSENKALKQELYSCKGKITRLEIKEKQLHEEFLDLETRLLQKDLIFYNVPVVQDENPRLLKSKVLDILRDSMKIPAAELYDRNNLYGEIRIDTAHRVGHPSAKKRPIVVTFSSLSAREQVYSPGFIKNLKKNSKIKIAEHYPPEIRERRSAQIEKMIALREENPHDRIVVKRDKLFVNREESDNDLFERNPLPNVTPISISYDELNHSETIDEKGSYFNAHSASVRSPDHAAAARNSIFQHPTLAESTHVIYAYKTTSDLGIVESGFSDDGEYQAGNILMNLINDYKFTNIFLAVTRLKKGRNIGNRRFEIIEEVATNLLDKLLYASADVHLIQNNIGDHVNITQDDSYVQLLHK